MVNRRDVTWAVITALVTLAFFIVTLRPDVGGTEDSPTFQFVGQVLGTDARYIGMIGSRRKVLTAMQHLHARGIPVEALQRVHAPIGIDIGAVTADEIAVSVVAQLIHIRRGGSAHLRYKSDDMRMLLRDLEPPQFIAKA